MSFRWSRYGWHSSSSHAYWWHYFSSDSAPSRPNSFSARLLSLPESDSCVEPYGWKSFLTTLFQDGNAEGREVPVTFVRPTTFDVNGGPTLQIYCKRFDQSSPPWACSGMPVAIATVSNVRHFVLGVRFHDIFLMTRDCGAQRLTAASGWTCRQIYCAGKETTWCRTRKEVLDYLFFQMEEESNYIYCLSVMAGKFLRLLHDGDLCEDSLQTLICFRCLVIYFFWLGFSINALFRGTILTLKHGMRLQTLSARIITGCHSVGLSATHPVHEPQPIFSARSLSWVSIANKRLPLLPSPLVYGY